MIPLPTSVPPNLLLSRLPSSANGPAQLLTPTPQSWFLSFGLTPTSNPTSPNSNSVSKLHPKSIHFSHSLCHQPALGHTLLPGLTAALVTLLVLLALYHSTWNSTKYKSDPAVPIFHPSTPQKSFPRPTKPSGSQALRLTAGLPTYAVVCFSLFEPASRGPAPGPGHPICDNLPQGLSTDGSFSTFSARLKNYLLEKALPLLELLFFAALKTMMKMALCLFIF